MACWTASAKWAEGPALDGQRGMPLALRLSEGLGVTARREPATRFGDLYFCTVVPLPSGEESQVAPKEQTIEELPFVGPLGQIHMDPKCRTARSQSPVSAGVPSVPKACTRKHDTLDALVQNPASKVLHHKWGHGRVDGKSWSRRRRLVSL